jgi:hypothetical protein
MVTKKASIALGLFLSARALFPRTQNNVLSPLAVVFPFLGALMNFACYPFARLAAAITAVTILAMSSQSAWSQTTKTIKIVVPYQPGGGNDILAALAHSTAKCNG